MRTLIVTIALTLGSGAVSTLRAQETPALRAAERQIKELGGGLYSASDGNQFTVFLLTSEGIVLVDPLSVAMAQWLSEQFAARFPGQQVRYVLLTHHHSDRASGAAVFRAAQRVGHSEYRAALRQSYGKAPQEYRFVANPTMTFDVRHTITLGGQTIELVHTGPFHSGDMAVVVFRPQRTVFAVTPPPFARVPFDFGAHQPADVVVWFDRVAPIDFDRILFDDGTQAVRAAIAPLADYLRTMYDAVRDGYERGRSLDELRASVTLSGHNTLPHYAGRSAQIAAIYRRARLRRVDIAISGVANYFPENPPPFCAAFARCSSGGAVPAATVGMTLALGRRVGVQAEVTASQQLWSTRIREDFDEETVLRPLRAGVYFKYNLMPSGAISVLGGYSTTSAEVRGMDRVRGQLIPVGGRHAIHQTNALAGITGGIELSQRLGAWRLLVPIRVTRVHGDLPRYWPTAVNVQAGAGIAIPLFREVR